MKLPPSIVTGSLVYLVEQGERIPAKVTSTWGDMTGSWATIEVNGKLYGRAVPCSQLEPR